jgi:hypothetical protein
VPDFDEVVGDEGGEEDDEAVSGDGDQPLDLLQRLGAPRLQVAPLAPTEVFQFLKKMRKIGHHGFDFFRGFDLINFAIVKSEYNLSR